MQKEDVTLHFSMPLEATDWENLALSSVRRVLLPLTIYRPDDLVRLKAMNVRVFFRIDESGYYTDDAPRKLRERVENGLRLCQVEGVIVGCEPENPVASLGYGAPDWGQSLAFEHVRRMDAVLQALRAIPAPLVLVASGWTARTTTEDSEPAPGTLTWRDICRETYWKCDGVGAHLYHHGWSFVDAIRFKFNLQKHEELFHLPVYIDEVGVPGDDVAQMKAYIEIAEILMKSRLGERVRMLSPFVSNGTPGNPPSWNPNFLLTDPNAYRLLGEWMRTPSRARGSRAGKPRRKRSASAPEPEREAAERGGESPPTSRGRRRRASSSKGMEVESPPERRK